MNATQHPYSRETDLPAILALKQLCTTLAHLYDRPTTGEMRRLLALFAERTTGTRAKPLWAQAIQGLPPEQRHHLLTQRLTALWEDARGQLVAYALIAQPGSSLDFQVHPEARGQGIEEAILAWGLAQMQLFAQARGTPCDLWCRCHAIELERRSLLEAAGFHPLFEPDMRLVHPLATPLAPAALPEGFSLKRGVTPPEFGAYRELHQAVYDGLSMNMDYHESSAYQGELDLIAVEESGRFAAFCQCELKRVANSQGEHLAGEIGLIGTRPELTNRGLGRALLLTGLRLLHERGAASAYLETPESNVPAQRLFRSVGFVHLSIWQWYAKTVEPA